MVSKRVLNRCLAATIGFGLALMNSLGVYAAAPELTLDDSVALALKNNAAVKMAELDKEKAKWGVQEAEAGLWPSLSLGSSANRSQGSSALLPNDNYSSSLRLNWSLYTGGRTQATIDQAQKGAHSAELGVVKAEQQLRLDATTAYFNALQARNMVKVNQQAVANLTTHLDKVKVQFEVGAVAKADLLRSEVELANAEQNLTKAQNGYDVALAALNNVIGAPLDTQSVLKDELQYSKCDLSVDDSIQLAVKNRPELAQSQDSIGMAASGVKVADSGKLPTISLSGSQGWSGNEFPGDNSNWSVGISASWNIFDAGITNAKIKSAQAAMDKVKEQDRQLRQSVELEVRQAYLSMKEAEQRIQTTQVAVDKAQEDVNIAQTKYNAGAGTNLDVIDAQLALTQANTNYTQALYDYNVNKAKLEKAIGQNIKVTGG